MKKLICLFLCITLLIPMAVSCSKDSAVESNERETRTKRSGKKDKETDEEDKDEFLSSLFEDSIVPEENEEFSETDDRIKVGFIYLHDENSAYDLNFMTAAKTACEEMGVEYVEKTQVPESNACYDAAVELVEVDKCDIIFADSYGHEQFMIMAAKEYPETEFCHASGVMAHTEKLDNYHNAYASIYEGRYLTGVAAGMKLNEMIEEGEITAEETKMGYVGTFTFAEVISAYTSFYLGAKSVCPSVTMDVKFTGSHCDETREKEAANALIEGGCVLISQYSESLGVPVTCENPDEIGAVLEALAAESYRSVVEVYFETALKAKYSSDSYSAQCVDIIRSVAKKYFFAEYASASKNFGFELCYQVRDGANTLSSAIASKSAAASTALQTFIADLQSKTAANNTK